MKKIFTPFTLFMALITGNLQAQVNVQNNSVLFVSTTADTLFINGTFTNSSGANFTNNANVYVKQDIINDQPSLPAGTGTLYLNGSSAQNVGGAQRLNTNNFVINNNAGVTLGNDLSVKSTFTLTNGIFALNNNNATLLSDINNTANVAPLVGVTPFTYGTGKFIVERFILARRSWRLLTAPVITTQTINGAWQEGQTGGTNTLPGYGTHVTGGTALNGFDQGVNGNAGMKEYIAGAWNGIANTNATVVTSKPGYMVFVRGDRSIVLSQATGAIPTTTVLRTSGQLNTGDQSYSVTAAGFTLIGNPYASPIDLHSLTKTNVQDNFYVWDPKITGPNGVGGFVNISWNGSSYDITPSSGGSNLTQYIQSGSAFLARSLNGSSTGTLVIKETDKSSIASINANRATNTSTATLNTNLYSVNADGSTSVVDGILNSFNTIYSDNIDGYDAAKLDNFAESLANKREGELLVVERKQPAGVSDTIFLNMLRMKVKSYYFELVADNFSNNGLLAFLEDSYINTSTPVDLRGVTIFNFNVINVPGSWNPGRFRIVFKQAIVLPVTFGAVRAFAQNNNIAVEWKVENETNIKQYEIERSGDGRQFIKIVSVIAKGNGSRTSNYNWLDETTLKGNNYYRIKSIGDNGEIKYSSVMKVYMGKDKQGITLATNIITNNIITLQMTNMPKGTYALGITNTSGQLMYTKKIEHEEGTGTESIELNKNFATGIYHLNIVNPDFTTLTMKLLME